MKNKILSRVLLTCALLAWGVAAQAQQVFRITAIPDESPTELARKAAPLAKYLEQKLGTKVEFTPVTDYAAAVEALVNKQVDLAWFGGFTFVQANQRSGGKIVPLVQREEDEKFRSVFITTDPTIKSLADLKGHDFTFGSQSSTSGHLMPRSYMLAGGVDPDKHLKRVAFAGAHDATVAAVASGTIEMGERRSRSGELRTRLRSRSRSRWRFSAMMIDSTRSATPDCARTISTCATSPTRTLRRARSSCATARSYSRRRTRSASRAA